MEPPGREQLKLKRLCEERGRRWEGKRGVIFTQIKDTPFKRWAVLLSVPVQMSPYMPDDTANISKCFPLCVHHKCVTDYTHNRLSVQLSASETKYLISHFRWNSLMEWTETMNFRLFQDTDIRISKFVFLESHQHGHFPMRAKSKIQILPSLICPVSLCMCLCLCPHFVLLYPDH